MSAPPPLNPYVGPSAFRQEDAHLFFGRDREAKSLVSLVMAESLVLFFAQSGTGKTSLIQAKLVPELPAQGLDILPVARVGGDPPAGTAPTNVYVFSALRSLAGPEADPARLQSLTLGAFLWTLPAREERVDSRRLLVFDQFEEILTTQPQHWEEREGFFLQLRQALEDEPSLSVLLVMREDNLAGLEPYAPLLPGKLRTRFRMESLRLDDAITAVCRPAELGCRPFDPSVAEHLVDDLRRVRVEGADASYLGEFVEPLQLQVVCYELWENLRPRQGVTITKEDLAACGDIDEALETFYERAVHQASERSGVPSGRIRQWCGKALITPRTRIRSQVSLEPGTTAGLPNAAVRELVATRLVREQPARGGTWYELVHDRFIEPVLRVNDRWQQVESTPLRRDAEAWDRAGRDASYLYRGQQLEEARRPTPAGAEERSPLESDFLADSETAERRQLSELRQKASLRRSILALGLMLLVVTFLAIYAYRESRRSTSRELAAEARNRLESDPDSGLRLAVKAVTTAVTPEAEGALHAALSGSRVRKLWWTPMKSANYVAFSPDGKRLATAGDDGQAEIWDVLAGLRIRQLTGHTAAVNCVAFSPDGRWLATGDSEGTVLVRRATGEPVLGPLDLGSEQVNVNGLAFSPDGKTLAVASDSPVPTLWNTETGQRIMELRGGHEDVVWDVSFSGDGRLLATGGEDKRVIVWDLATGKPRLLKGHTAGVTGVAFRPSKGGEPTTLLASSSQDGTARLWNLESGSSYPLFGHKGQVWGVAFSPDGSALATASFDGSAKIWDVASQEELFTLSPGAGEVVKVAFSPTQGLVATASHAPRDSEEGGVGVATVWRVLLQDEAPTLSLAEGVLGTAFSRDGNLFAAYGRGGRGVLWTPGSASRSRIWCPGAPPLAGVTFSDGGAYVACTTMSGRVVVARTEGPASASIALPSKETLSLQPRPGLLVISTSGGDLLLVDPRRTSWRVLQGRSGDVPVRCVAMSPGGSRLAVGRSDGSVLIEETAKGRVLLRLAAHRGSVLAVAFSPDGTHLATGGKDLTAKLWDLSEEGREIVTFPGHRAPVSSVAFSSDGTVLATGDISGTIRLEALDLRELSERARRRLAQSLSTLERR